MTDITFPEISQPTSPHISDLDHTRILKPIVSGKNRITMTGCQPVVPGPLAVPGNNANY